MNVLVINVLVINVLVYHKGKVLSYFYMVVCKGLDASCVCSSIVFPLLFGRLLVWPHTSINVKRPLNTRPTELCAVDYIGVDQYILHGNFGISSLSCYFQPNKFI